jgi:phage terminase large subunit-like protein
MHPSIVPQRASMPQHKILLEIRRDSGVGPKAHVCGIVIAGLCTDQRADVLERFSHAYIAKNIGI